MYRAPATAPAIEASWFPLGSPLPAKKAAPPWLYGCVSEYPFRLCGLNRFGVVTPAVHRTHESCNMIGDLDCRAASRAATTVEDEVTLMA